MAIFFNASAPSGWGVDENGRFTKIPDGYLQQGNQFVPPTAAPAVSTPTSATSTAPKPTTQIASPAPVASVQKEILVGDAGRLYSWDGNSLTYIPNQSTLASLVSQGFKDTRKSVGSIPAAAQKLGLTQQNQAPAAPVQQPQQPAAPQAQAVSSGKEILTGSNGRLYAFDGQNLTYIPNQATLAALVQQQGFRDSRRALGALGLVEPGGAPTSSPAGPTSSPVPSAPTELPSAPATPATPLQPGTSFSGQSLVRFNSDPNGGAPGDASTVWLLDADTKQLRPFLSEQAFNSYFQNPDAWNDINVVDPSFLSDQGSLAGFKLLDASYGIQNSGQVANPDFNTSTLQSSYGNQGVSEEEKSLALSYLKAIKLNMDVMLQNGTLKGFTKQSLDAVFADSGQLAKMISAMAYGGYDANDVTREAMRLAMVKDGRTDLANLSVISDSKKKSEYASSDTYKSAVSNPQLFIPQNAVEKIMSATTRPEYFQEGVVKDMMNTDQFKQEMDSLRSTYHDIVDQQLSANTDRARQIAQTNWDNFKSTVEKRYGIQLANNASEAWGQIQSLETNFNNAGLLNTGMYNEAFDKYLNRVRRQDQQVRLSKLTEGEQQEAAYYTSSASPAEIKALIEKDRTSGLPREQWKSVKWGLLPSEDIKAQFSVDALTQKMMQDYPGTPEWMAKKQAQMLVDATLDENGNYRSSLYSNFINSKNQNELARLNYQQTTVLNKAVSANDKIFEQYQTPDATSEDFFSTPSTVGQPLGAFPSSTGAPSTAPALIPGVTTQASSPALPPVTSTPSIPTAPVSSNPYAGLTKITNPSELSKYTESQIVRDPGSSAIYLKSSAPAPSPAPSTAAINAAAAISGNTVSKPSSSSTVIPFKTGLTPEQQKSITTLTTKTDWNKTDLGNWNYATNSAKVPSGIKVTI